MKAPALLALLALTGCARKKEPAPAERGEVPALSEVEIQRGKDACAAYQQRVCEAAKADPSRGELAEACNLAPASSDAMRTALEIALHPESTRRDVLQAQDSVRKTMNHCLEQLAKLPMTPLVTTDTGAPTAPATAPTAPATAPAAAPR